MTRLTRRAFLEIAGLAGAGSLLARPGRADLISYDDGNLDVPGGLTDSVERVVIVGAGFSGLTVANAMRAAGVPYVVVEARDRIGGRIHTESVGGVPLDLGAAWLHGTIGNPVADWAAQHGIALVPADPSAGDISGYDPLIGTIPSAEAGAAFGVGEDFVAARAALRSALGSGASVEQGITAYLDAEGYTADVRRVLELVLRTPFAELPYAGSTNDLSLDWYSEDFEYFGGDYAPVGGYQGLVNALNDQLDIRLNEAVTDIAYGIGGVTVTTTSDVHTGSHVVVTTPIGVLKAGSFSFSPGLPTAKTAAIGRLEMGSYVKLYLQFSTAFWRNVFPPRENFFYVSNVAQGEYPVFLDWTAIAGGIPTLSCAIAGDFAASIAGLSEPAILARVEAILAEIFPDSPEVSAADRAPSAVAISNWNDDPFSLGAYPFIPVGASPADMDELAEPVDGRVLFAGDATQSDFYGSVPAAMLSGIREAKRLLAKPSVYLPEPGAWLPQTIGLGALLLLARWRHREALSED
jgi:polyamine oxidase